MTSDRSEAAIDHRHWFWDLLGVALALVGAAIGLHLVPSAIESVPFARAIPILLGISIGVTVSEVIRVMWISYRGPNSDIESYELGMASATLGVFVLLFLMALAKVWNKAQGFRRSISNA